ncbi:MAG: RagB/SusD family nutrient uptake outer membrane protein, partial [Bacteroidales bacterium]|nr:RagB/SusD family nutrient uptake outer membrane protein [Bacteroidales bacterium]
FIYKIALGALVLGTAVACDLNLEPWGSITYNPGDQIITTQADLDGFEANIMAAMRALNYGVFDYASDIEMDYFNAAVDFGNNGGDIHRSDNSFTAGSGEVGSVWATCYETGIKNFNVFLSGSTSVPDGIDPVKLAHARGEAFFGRAFAYMILARHFGKAYDPATAGTDLCVPLVTVYDQKARPARATVREIYDQIRSDLDSAAVLLADVTPEVRAVRPTSDAVKAMYARYCLDVKDWANAASYAAELCDSGKYGLCNSATAFTNEWVYDSGTESILQYYASMSEGTGSHSYYYGVSSMAGKYYTSEYYIPTKELVDSYSSSDLRKAAWFGTSHPGYPTWTIMSYHVGTYYNQTPSNPDYYVFSKYKGNPNYTTSFPGSAQARKALSIPEMYLIAAEAYFNAGDTVSARKYLNALQSARGTVQTQANLSNIKNEWYKETVGQGLRMSCLKRWGEGFDGRTPQNGARNIVMTGSDYDQKYLTAGDYRFVWPVPAYEMKVNDNLVQNPGYADVDVQ